jgi:predicted hydrolase (HD superfamily)
MAGLLHDIDLEQINGDMSAHSKVGAEIVKQHGVSLAIIHAILTHNEHHGIARESMMDKALFCVDPLTGLITAVALVRPERSSQPSKPSRCESGSRKRALPRAPTGK